MFLADLSAVALAKVDLADFLEGMLRIHLHPPNVESSGGVQIWLMELKSHGRVYQGFDIALLMT
jgi:hypothetical protein